MHPEVILNLYIVLMIYNTTDNIFRSVKIVHFSPLISINTLSPTRGLPILS
jgi:hypothetical protein